MDPVTIALLAAQGIAGTAKAGYGLYQQSQGRKALAGAYEAPTGKPSEYADMLKQARDSDLAQRRIDEINRSMATSTSALQQSGSRGVIGGIGAVTEAGSRAKTGALTAQQQEIMRALERGTIGGEYERQRGVARQTREETADEIEVIGQDGVDFTKKKEDPVTANEVLHRLKTGFIQGGKEGVKKGIKELKEDIFGRLSTIAKEERKKQVKKKMEKVNLPDKEAGKRIDKLKKKSKNVK